MAQSQPGSRLKILQAHPPLVVRGKNQWTLLELVDQYQILRPYLLIGQSQPSNPVRGRPYPNSTSRFEIPDPQMPRGLSVKSQSISFSIAQGYPSLLRCRRNAQSQPLDPDWNRPLSNWMIRWQSSNPLMKTELKGKSQSNLPSIVRRHRNSPRDRPSAQRPWSNLIVSLLTKESPNHPLWKIHSQNCLLDQEPLQWELTPTAFPKNPGFGFGLPLYWKCNRYLNRTDHFYLG